MIIKHILRSQPDLDFHHDLSCSDHNSMQSMAWVWRSEKPHPVCQSARGVAFRRKEGFMGHFSVILCMNGRVVRGQKDPISVQRWTQPGAEMCHEVAGDAQGDPMVAVVMERRIRYDVEGYLMLLAGHLEMTVGTGKNPR